MRNVIHCTILLAGLAGVSACGPADAPTGDRGAGGQGGTASGANGGSNGGALGGAGGGASGSSSGGAGASGGSATGGSTMSGAGGTGGSTTARADAGASGGTGGMAGAGGTGGGAAGTGGTGGAPPAAGGCPTTANTAAWVLETIETNPIPASMGGAVKDGKYHLTAAGRYVGAAGAGTMAKNNYKHTLVITGAGTPNLKLEFVEQNGMTKPEERSSFTGVLSAPTSQTPKLTLTTVCPAGTPGVSWRYTATATTLVLIDVASTDPTTGKTFTYTLTK